MKAYRRLVLRSEKSVPELLMLVTSDDERITYDARKRAIWLLGYIGDSRAVEPLSRMLRTSGCTREIATALGRIGDPDAIPHLVCMLETIEKSRELKIMWSTERRAALEALARIGTSRAIQAIESRLVDGRQVDSDVALALGIVPRPRALLVLERVLGDQTLENQVDVMRAIARIGGASSIRILGGVITGGDGQGDPNTHAMRRSAARYIAMDRWCSMAQVLWRRQESVGAIPPLIDALGSQDSGLREEAAESLGEIGNRLAVHALSQVLKDPEAEVRKAAYEALGMIGGGKATKALLEAVPTERECWAQVALAEALGRLGDARGVQALAPLVEDSDEEVREAVADAFGEIGVEEAIPHLAKLLADKESDVAVHAAVSVGKVGGQKAVAVLKSHKAESQMLKDAIEAATWLAKGPYTIKQLESAMQSPSAPIRKTAVIVLSHQPSSEAIKLLRRAAAESEDVGFASQVWAVVRRLTNGYAWW